MARRSTRKAAEVVRVAPYLRASKDRYGTAKSVDDQGTDYAESLAAHRDWREVARFVDNNRSASRFARREREDFGRLLMAIDAGDIDVLWLWEFSRSQRRLKIYAELAELCRDRGVKWFIFTSGRMFDLESASDRMFLGFNALMAEAEAEALSERSQRGVRSNLRNGRPHGLCAYGYRRIYDEQTRAFVRQEHHPEQAPIVLEIAQRYASGEACNAIAVDLTRRGIPSPIAADMARRGKASPSDDRQWKPASIKRMALNPVYLGKRAYRRGRQSNSDGSAMAELHDAQWEPIVDLVTYEQCVKRSQRPPDRKWTRASRPIHLLSNVMLCGVCESIVAPTRVMAGGQLRPSYTCKAKGCVGAAEVDCDEVVVAEVCAFLDRPDVWEAAMAPMASHRAQQAHHQAAAARTELDQALALVKAGKLSVVAFADIEPALLARIEAAQATASRLSLPGPVAELLRGKGSALRRWNALDMGVRREVLRYLFTIRLLPVGRGQPFMPERVDITAKLGAATKAKPKRKSPVEIQAARLAERRSAVVKLHRRGLSNVAIGRELGVSNVTVGTDLRACGY